MARSKDIAGVAIAAAVKAVGVAPGLAVSDAQLEAVWKAAMNALFTHDASNALVAPGTMNIINPETGSPVPVTGVGGPIT